MSSILFFHRPLPGSIKIGAGVLKEIFFQIEERYSFLHPDLFGLPKFFIA